jgi:hypothetical protein
MEADVEEKTSTNVNQIRLVKFRIHELLFIYICLIILEIKHADGRKGNRETHDLLIMRLS